MFVRYTLSLLLLAILFSCGPKLPSQLKSPYQEALESYYRALDSQSFDEALNQVDDILSANPGDLEARALRIQLRFQQYRSDPDEAKRIRLFYDLRTLSRALNTGGQRADWVRPRLYVSVGDILLFDGYSLLRSMEADQGNMDFTFWKAYTHFLGAYNYYIYAESLAQSPDSVSRGMEREYHNAKDGIIHSLAGILESTSILDPLQEYPIIVQRRKGARSQLQMRINGIPPPTEVPDGSLIGLETSDQNIAAGLYRLNSGDNRDLLLTACAEPNEEGPTPEEIWDESCRDLERSAFHYLMQGLLTGTKVPDYDQSIQLMDVLLKRKEACP